MLTLACLPQARKANHPEGTELSLGPQVDIAVRVPVINGAVWDFSYSSLLMLHGLMFPIYVTCVFMSDSSGCQHFLLP